MLVALASTTIATMNATYQEYVKHKKTLRENLRDMNYYMHKRKISSNLQIKIKKYLEYMNFDEIKVAEKSTQIINNMLNATLKS